MGNLISGSSHHCCCECYCCLTEADKVNLIMHRFQPVSCASAVDNNLMMLVGRVVLCSNPLYAPATGVPCVWYHVTVQEELIKHRTTRDKHGHSRTQTYHEWHTIVDQSAFQDFYLQDGNSKVFINGSRPGLAKINGVSDSNGGSNIFTQPPPGIQWLIMQHLGNNFNWLAAANRTGRFRYTQESFDVNEEVAALGIVAPGQDGWGHPCKVLTPITANAVSPAFMEEQKWEEWDKESWLELVHQSPSVLISDQPKFCQVLQIPQIQDLPPYMLPDPNRDISDSKYYEPVGEAQK